MSTGFSASLGFGAWAREYHNEDWARKLLTAVPSDVLEMHVVMHGTVDSVENLLHDDFAFFTRVFEETFPLLTFQWCGNTYLRSPSSESNYLMVVKSSYHETESIAHLPLQSVTAEEYLEYAHAAEVFGFDPEPRLILAVTAL